MFCFLYFESEHKIQVDFVFAFVRLRSSSCVWRMRLLRERRGAQAGRASALVVVERESAPLRREGRFELASAWSFSCIRLMTVNYRQTRALTWLGV